MENSAYRNQIASSEADLDLQGFFSKKDKSGLLRPGPEVIKLFACSTQLSMKFIMLINVKMPTSVVILIFMSMINTTSEHLKARKVFIFKHFRFYEHFKFHAQLS